MRASAARTARAEQADECPQPQPVSGRQRRNQQQQRAAEDGVGQQHRAGVQAAPAEPDHHRQRHTEQRACGRRGRHRQTLADTLGVRQLQGQPRDRHHGHAVARAGDQVREGQTTNPAIAK
jgi:hypothetical protein